MQCFTHKCFLYISFSEMYFVESWLTLVLLTYVCNSIQFLSDIVVSFLALPRLLRRHKGANRSESNLSEDTGNHVPPLLSCYILKRITQNIF